MLKELVSMTQSARSLRFSSRWRSLENAIDKTVAVLQWVRAADGFVSFDKYVVVGIKEKDAGFDTEIIQVAEHGCQIVKVAAGTYVNDCGELVNAAV